MATRVVLHIGTMKSGTTFVQQVLRTNKDRLAERGILFPGTAWRQQVVAIKDLMAHGGPDQEPLDPEGPWNRMAADVRAWPGTAIISVEFLAPQPASKIEIIRAAFPDADLQVILTARDLTRSIVSTWTEAVQNRGVTTWANYVTAVRGRPSKGKGLARSFWRQQGIPDIAERWSAAVGREHFTLITVPPPGSPHTLLWERFCGVAGLDPELCHLDVPRNQALDAASAMVMRDLNERLKADGISREDYERYVKRALAKNGYGRRTTSGPAVGLSGSWALRKAQSELKRLRTLDVRVVGDLDELRSKAVRGVDPSKVSAEQQLAAAVEGMAILVTSWAEADAKRREKKKADGS